MDQLVSFSLSGKVVAITGGLGILGSYFVEGCLQAGADIAFTDREADLCANRASELSSKYERQVLGLCYDVGNPLEARAFIQDTYRQFGRIDVVVNGAATKGNSLELFLQATEVYSECTWNEILRTNISGMFWVSREAAFVMKQQNIKGSIIQISSIYGIVGPDNRIYEGSYYNGMPINTPAVYAATKGGVISLSKYLATELAEFGIRVNTLVPGGVASGQNEKFRSNYSDRVPLGRMANPEDMVGPLIFLASDASSYMTGQELIIDGGLTSW